MKLHHNYRDMLPAIFYSEQLPTPVRESRMAVYNNDLSKKLGIRAGISGENPGIFVGNEIPQNAIPIAQAYSGHQFGYFTRLGDGRAILLGEWESPDGTLWDIQLKGAGRTPYSRGGDGRAALGPMLREYLISEAMAGLGIPTTRSLAVAETGEPVYRETTLQGAVLTRIAKAHIRTGTFQYAREVGGNDAAKQLADYTIRRLYPELQNAKKPYLALLETVAIGQAKLIARWMGVGFIHGVMNTDNMSIAGETIDYGPCAFMDAYHPETVFSSIDHRGRYSYRNQPPIGQWNTARFAETLLGVIEETGEGQMADAKAVLALYEEEYYAAYRNVMAKKLGIADPKEADDALVQELLQWMQDNKADYTNTFITLTEGDTRRFPGEWMIKWEKRIGKQNEREEQTRDRMRSTNPVVIPRNHLVEQALKEAEQGDLSMFYVLSELYKNPYDYVKEIDDVYMQPMPEDQSRRYRTFCGT